MNRILRSPYISEEPVVIAVQPHGHSPAAGAEGEDAFSDISPTADTVESPEDFGESAAKGGEPVGQDSSGAPVTGETGEVTDASPEGPIESANTVGDLPTQTADGEPGEEGEIMIGLEEVAERDVAASTTIGDHPESGAEEELSASASEIEAIVEARLAEFEERFQQEKEDAYHAGFEDGTNEGTKQGLNQSEEEVGRFQQLVDTLTGQWKDTLRPYDAEVTDLSIRIAQKIIDVEVEQNQEAVLKAVHDCLAYVEDKTKVIIRVNPDDLEAVRRHRNDWLESLESIDHLLIEAEPSVSKGGCVVETPIGDVDAQIEERLERLRTALLEEINRTDDSQET